MNTNVVSDTNLCELLASDEASSPVNSYEPAKAFSAAFRCERAYHRALDLSIKPNPIPPNLPNNPANAGTPLVIQPKRQQPRYSTAHSPKRHTLVPGHWLSAPPR